MYSMLQCAAILGFRLHKLTSDAASSQYAECYCLRGWLWRLVGVCQAGQRELSEELLDSTVWGQAVCCSQQEVLVQTAEENKTALHTSAEGKLLESTAWC